MEIAVKHLCKSFGGRTVLRDLTFTAGPGITAVMAPSGTGKTTLLRILLGLERPDVVEDGDTFEANAALKARSACRVTGLPAIADDSGLCVDYLAGAPGIYSARFSGGHGNDEANNDLLLQKLEGVPMEQRTAYYVCAICCVFPDGEELTVRGECHGHIGFERDGNAGFGYAPLFLVEGRSFGRYTAEEKDKISHRGRALRTLAAELEKRI